MIRRLALAGLLLTTACVGAGTEPSGVVSISVAFTLASAGVFPGDSVQLNATPLDYGGGVVPVAITYASSNPAVATINTGGLIVAVTPGTTQITVSAGGQSTRLSLVVDGNITGSLFVTPVNPTATLGAGGVQLTASVLTTLGNPARGKSVNWSTADATKATVNTAGLVTPVAATVGVQICATVSDATTVKGCTTVAVH